jgi:hypothetical protein
MAPRHCALTELAGWTRCCYFSAELFDLGTKRHLAASMPLLAEAFEVECRFSPGKQFGMHPGVRYERVHSDLLPLDRDSIPLP